MSRLLYINIYDILNERMNVTHLNHFREIITNNKLLVSFLPLLHNITLDNVTQINAFC